MKQRLAFFFVLFVPLASLLIAVFTLGHYGINWDEPYHYRRGQAYLHYFLTGNKTYGGLPKYPPLAGESDNPSFRDAQQNWEEIHKDPSLSDPKFHRSFYQDDSWNGQYFIDQEKSFGHPPLNGILASVFNRIFYQQSGLLGDIEAYHLFIATAVSLATFSIAFFIWKEFGLLESIFSSLIFATYPLILGEQHFNIKDPVEAAFYTITVICAYLGIKRNKFSWLFVSSIFFGLSLTVKFNILFSLIPLSLWLFSYLRQEKGLNRKKLFNNLWVIILTAPVIILGIFIASNPSLWANPFEGIKQTVNFYLSAGYPQSQPAGYFLTDFFNAYPSVWILYTTPPIVVLLLLKSFIHLKDLIKKNSFVLLLFLWLITATARNSLFGALSYGGVRLIMEYIPALAMLGGITAGYMIRKAKGYRPLMAILLVAAFIPTLYKLVRIHPNENTYFNFLAGGLSGAKERNIPSWGDSYGNAYYQGVLWLNDHAEQNAKVSTPVGNTSNVPRIKLRPDLAVSPNYWSGLKHEGEYLIELTYDYPPQNWFSLRFLETAMVPVYQVKVDNVAIAKVWKNDRKYVIEEYQNTKEIRGQITIDKKAKTVYVQIPKTEEIMAVSLTQPTVSCSPIATGVVETSEDGKSWIREPEDAALDQLNRHELKEPGTTYEFLFMAKRARFIKFSVDGESACLLTSRAPVVTVLE